MNKLKFVMAKGLKIILNPPALRKCDIDHKSRVCSGTELNNVSIGKYSYIGNNCFMVNVDIKNYCSIADRCVIGGAAHPINRVSTSPVFHSGKNIMKTNFANFPKIDTPKTVIENDVWIGMGCYIKAGVTIHNGAVIGMGSIVTKDIPPYEIWAGNPAKKIRDRFSKNIADDLETIKWWEWNVKKINEAANLFDNVESFIHEYRK